MSSDIARILILATMFIYIRCGRTIYYKRKDLQHIRPSDSDPMSFNEEATTTLKTTEVTVTSTEAPLDSPIQLQPMSRGGTTTTTASNGGYFVTPGGYVVTIAATPRRPSTTHNKGGSSSKGASSQAAASRPSAASGPQTARRVTYEVNNAAWAYTKCAILFFTALLITWIPSSANRVYSFVHGTTIPTLEFMSAFVLPLQGFWNAIIYAVTSWNACKNLWGDMRQGRRPVVTELVGGMQPRGQQTTYGQELTASQSRSARRTRKGGGGESESMTELAGSDGRSI